MIAATWSHSFTSSAPSNTRNTKRQAHICGLTCQPIIVAPFRRSSSQRRREHEHNLIRFARLMTNKESRSISALLFAHICYPHLTIKRADIANRLSEFSSADDAAHDLARTRLGQAGSELKLIGYSQRADSGANVQF